MLVASVMFRQNQDLCVSSVQAVKWFAEVEGFSGQWSSRSGQTINKIQECVIIYQLARYILQQPSSPGARPAACLLVQVISVRRIYFTV